MAEGTVANKDVCWYYLQGRCKFGKNCKKSHETSTQKVTKDSGAEDKTLEQNVELEKAEYKYLKGMIKIWNRIEENVESLEWNGKGTLTLTGTPSQLEKCQDEIKMALANKQYKTLNCSAVVFNKFIHYHCEQRNGVFTERSNNKKVKIYGETQEDCKKAEKWIQSVTKHNVKRVSEYFVPKAAIEFVRLSDDDAEYFKKKYSEVLCYTRIAEPQCTVGRSTDKKMWAEIMKNIRENITDYCREHKNSPQFLFEMEARFGHVVWRLLSSGEVKCHAISEIEKKTVPTVFDTRLKVDASGILKMCDGPKSVCNEIIAKMLIYGKDDTSEDKCCTAVISVQDSTFAIKHIHDDCHMSVLLINVACIERVHDIRLGLKCYRTEDLSSCQYIRAAVEEFVQSIKQNADGTLHMKGQSDNYCIDFVLQKTETLYSLKKEFKKLMMVAVLEVNEYEMDYVVEPSDVPFLLVKGKKMIELRFSQPVSCTEYKDAEVEELISTAFELNGLLDEG